MKRNFSYFLIFVFFAGFLFWQKVKNSQPEGKVDVIQSDLGQSLDKDLDSQAPVSTDSDGSGLRGRAAALVSQPMESGGKEIAKSDQMGIEVPSTDASKSSLHKVAPHKVKHTQINLHVTSDEAEELYKKAKMDLASENEVVALGVFYLKKGSYDPERAKELFSKAVEMDFENEVAVNELVNLYIMNGEEGRASSLLRGLLQRSPNSQNLQESLGNFLSYQKKYRESGEAYEKALQVGSYQEGIARKKAIAFMKAGELSRAADTYRNMEERAQNSKDKEYIGLELANLLAKNQSCEESAQILKKLANSSFQKELKFSQETWNMHCHN